MRNAQRRSQRGRHRLFLTVGTLVACGIAGFLALLSQGSQSKPLQDQSAPKEFTLKLNGPIDPASAGTIMALADDLFRRQGLRVQFQRGTDDTDVISSVVADDRVIGQATAAGLLKARAEGLPIVAFAASYIVSSVEFFALSKTRLLAPSDLEGQRIGYKPGPEIATLLHAFISKNALAQSRLQLMESDTALNDLLNGKIDILIGHREIEGLALERAKVSYRSLSPDSSGVHGMGPVYFANERAFLAPRNLEKLLVAIANGWNAAYSDFKRTIPIIARAVDDPTDPALISQFMDTQRRWLRPLGTRFGELDLRRLRVLQGQLLQQRIIQQPVDLARAVNYNILTEIYRTEANIFTRIEP